MAKYDGVGYYNGRGTTDYWGTSMCKAGMRLQFRGKNHNNVTINAFNIRPNIAHEIAMHFYQFRSGILPDQAIVQTKQDKVRYWFIDILGRKVRPLSKGKVEKLVKSGEFDSLFLPNPCEENVPLENAFESQQTQQNLSFSATNIGACVGQEEQIDWVNELKEEMPEYAREFFRQLNESILDDNVHSRVSRMVKKYAEMLD